MMTTGAMAIAAREMEETMLRRIDDEPWVWSQVRVSLRDTALIAIYPALKGLAKTRPSLRDWSNDALFTSS
jgi:hypothetical protein